MSKGDVFEDNDRVLGGVLLQQVLEVGGASTQDHLVSFGVLTLKNSINKNVFFRAIAHEKKVLVLFFTK